VEMMLDRVTSVAANVGLDFHYEDVHQTNTVKAHELLHFAKSRGLQLEMKERLLKAYFVDGGHVGRIADLADLAAEVGLDRADAVVALESGQYVADVKADVAAAQAYGIQGVPFFVIDGKYGISGAQEPDAFRQALSQVRDERAAEATGEPEKVQS
jgi:predicted DsbA family dithiol-disulfide isomerase